MKQRILLVLYRLSLITPLLSAGLMQNAEATPAFSRQTGEPCSACHMQSYGPWLTQYGQKFKLDGYVAGNANSLPTLLNNFSAESVSSITNTQGDVPKGTYFSNSAGVSNTNNNVVNDWDAIYYTGRIAEKVGSYLQLNFSPQVGRSVSLAMADIRYADHTSFNDHHVNYGVTVNNAPTMSDFWMTTYAWMYPYTTSSVAPKPAAQPWLAALMSGANTAGATAYTMIDNHFYLEGGGYTSQGKSMAEGLGVWGGSQSNGLLVGGAPYWRMFYQTIEGPHTFMIGTYGLSGNVSPSYDAGGPLNSYTEYNVDSNYWYMLDDDNMLMAMFRYTRDAMEMGAGKQGGYSSNSGNNLNATMLMGMWTYKQTYNLTFGWNDQWGSSDLCLYNGGGCSGGAAPTIDPINGSANGSPNSNSFMVEADYIPFGKGHSELDPYLNVRLSLQYWAYTTFNGASSNYSGSGRSAEDNNTMYFVTNVAF